MPRMYLRCLFTESGMQIVTPSPNHQWPMTLLDALDTDDAIPKSYRIEQENTEPYRTTLVRYLVCIIDIPNNEVPNRNS